MSHSTIDEAKYSVPMQGSDYLLYGGIVFSWSFSWFAIILQLGVVAPEVSLVWRFLLSSVVMFIWVLWSKRAIKFPISTHGIFLCLGLCLFSANFYCFYQAGNFLVSGFLSVIFSLASIVNLVLGFLLFRHVPTKQMIFGALLGVSGVVLMFWPQLSETGIEGDGFKGLLWCLAGVSFFCCGNQIASRLKNRNVGMRSATTWGMFYGTLIAALFSYCVGSEFIIEWNFKYIGALVFLSLISSVLAFACYLGLLDRIGAGRASYVTVLFPIMALLTSTILEDFHWNFLAILGVSFALFGNFLVIRPKKAKVT